MARGISRAICGRSGIIKSAMRQEAAMDNSVQQITREALALSREERQSLADALLHSLESGNSSSALETAKDAEVQTDEDYSTIPGLEKLTHERLREYAKNHPPPASWYDEPSPFEPDNG
jgi:hypothetical protein